MNEAPDMIVLQRWMTTLALVLVTAFLCVKAVMAPTLFRLSLLIAMPLVVYFMNNPQALLIGVFFANAANLNIPGLPGQLTLTHVGMAGIVGIGVARMIIEKRTFGRKEVSEKILIVGLAVALITMYARGSGIRALGSNLWGGMHYVTILLGGCFYLIAPEFRIPARRVKTLVGLILAATLLPALAQILFTISGGRIHFLYFLINYSDIQYVAESLRVVSDPQYISRLTSFGGIAAGLLPLAFVFAYRGPTRWIQAGIIGSCMVFAMLSGGRSAIMATVGIVLIMGFFAAGKKRRGPYLFALFAFGMFMLFMLVLFVDQLPLSAQRSLSWIPFIEISPIASIDAKASTDWRLEIWRCAWDELPRYLLLGKGFSFDPGFLAAASRDWADPRNSFLVHNYHSGPITLLLDLGVVGLVVWSAFLFRVFYEHLRNLRWLKASDLPSRYYYYLVASYLWSLASFFVIFGDVSSLLFFLLRGSLMRVLIYSIEEDVAAAAKKAPVAAVREPLKKRHLPSVGLSPA